ncbi:hypothetical protein K456DRAFT_1749394 [Colletotrichum gloeosporioides 23]|nr:hypothetical protein K456DRAFT_1749394 [Colletotrichum gloeosporioides 23]
MAQTTHGAHKRLISCCDGTWMDSLGKQGTCHDGTHQIIMYDPGVGSSDSYNIRELSNFICANYIDGDDIILIGFSRGAFTARSVADMIATVGLLTPLGLGHFYAVFEDYESVTDVNRDQTLFLDPQVLPYDSEKGKAKRESEKERKLQYEEWLTKNGYTRHKYQDGTTEIKIEAIGVWDTVGTLGNLPAPVIGLRGSSNQQITHLLSVRLLLTSCTWEFPSTQILDHVEDAFHALALDEPRYAFRPALWERLDNTKTNLEQVWLPGSHSTAHGSWLPAKKSFPWAKPEICAAKISSVKRSVKRDAAECNGKNSHPAGSDEDLWKLARPWGLGLMRDPGGRLQTIGGTTVRHPGIFKRTDPDTNQDSDEALLDTNERIYNSVRVRLACQGLALDDVEIWDCKPLTRAADGSALWKLERGSGLTASELRKLYPVGDRDGQWRCVLVDKRRGAVSLEEVLPEEPVTGYWERYFLALTAGNPGVWRWAEENPPLDAAGSKA